MGPLLAAREVNELVIRHITRVEAAREPTS